MNCDLCKNNVIIENKNYSEHDSDTKKKEE